MYCKTAFRVEGKLGCHCIGKLVFSSVHMTTNALTCKTCFRQVCKVFDVCYKMQFMSSWTKICKILHQRSYRQRETEWRLVETDTCTAESSLWDRGEVLYGVIALDVQRFPVSLQPVREITPLCLW